MQITVADPGFRRGSAKLKGVPTYYFGKDFLENEESWAWASVLCLCRSATEQNLKLYIVSIFENDLNIHL